MNFTKPGVRVDFGIGDFWRNFFEFEKKGEYINFLKLSAIIHLWHQGKMERSKWNKDFWGRGKGYFAHSMIWWREGSRKLRLSASINFCNQPLLIFCHLLCISSYNRNVFLSRRNIFHSEQQLLQPTILIFCLLLCISSYNRNVFLPTRNSTRNIFHSEHQFLQPTIIIFHLPLCISSFTRNVFPSDIDVFLGVPQFLQTAILIQPFSLSNPSSASLQSIKYIFFLVYKYISFLSLISTQLSPEYSRWTATHPWNSCVVVFLCVFFLHLEISIHTLGCCVLRFIILCNTSIYCPSGFRLQSNWAF